MKADKLLKYLFVEIPILPLLNDYLKEKKIAEADTMTLEFGYLLKEYIQKGREEGDVELAIADQGREIHAVGYDETPTSSTTTGSTGDS